MRSRLSSLMIIFVKIVKTGTSVTKEQILKILKREKLAEQQVGLTVDYEKIQLCEYLLELLQEVSE